MDSILVGKREIGPGKPAFVIVEIGSNFDCSDLEAAKKLVDRAAAGGADAVKVQTFRAEKLITGNALKPAYQKGGSGDRETYQHSLRKFELSEEAHMELKEYCEERQLLFLSTPHGQEESVELLERVGVSAYKLASGDLTNLPFLRFVAKKGKPIFLSTGMANMGEVREAVSAIRGTGNDQIVALQCTASYPCRPEDANLRAMASIRQQCGVLVGFSDHSTTISLPVAAVALGAVVIEKHFTLDRGMKGPDHKSSIEPLELAQMVRCIREVEGALGSAEKKPLAKELELAKIARKSVIAAVDIKAGQTIAREMLEVKRPGTGIPPGDIGKVVGRKAKKGIARDSVISLGELQ